MVGSVNSDYFMRLEKPAIFVVGIPVGHPCYVIANNPMGSFGLDSLAACRGKLFGVRDIAAKQFLNKPSGLIRHLYHLIVLI